MFWIITRFLWKRKLQKCQKRLKKKMAAYEMESPVPQAFYVARKENDDISLRLKVLESEKALFVKKKILKERLEGLINTRAEMLNSLASMGLPEDVARDVIEKEKWMAQEMKVIEGRLEVGDKIDKIALSVFIATIWTLLIILANYIFFIHLGNP